MAEPRLEIGDNRRFHHVEWAVQRVGWGVIALVLLAALCGWLGSAHFGQQRLASPDGSLQLEYPRFARYQTGARLALHALVPADGLRVWLPADYVRRMNLQRVDPEPERVEAEAQRLVFMFNARPAQAAPVVFHFKPESFGHLRGRIGVVGGAELAFRQLVYP